MAMQEYQEEHKDADAWLEQLKECKQLSEHSVKLLCDKASAFSQVLLRSCIQI